MVDKVLINNIEKYELSFFKIAMQLRAINYLEEKKALNEKICKCAKAKIKENCTDSKTIREEMIKEAFVDSYKLLSSNTNFETEEFLNLMHDTMNENNRQDELEKFKKEFVDIKSKKSKLIDLMVEDKISENDYNEK